MRLAPLDNSVIFKKLFTDPDILSAFIYDLLGIKLNLKSEDIQTEKKFKPPVGHIDFAYDIFVDAPDDRVIVEIQRVRYDDHYDRFFHYFVAALAEIPKSYREYRLNRTVHTIVWLTRAVHDKQYQSSVITNTILAESDRGEKFQIYPHKLYFLNPNYVHDKTASGVADWLNLVRESIKNPEHPEVNDEREIIDRAVHLIADDDLTAGEVSEFINEKEAERYLRVKHEEGRQEGIEEGMEKGMERCYQWKK